MLYLRRWNLLVKLKLRRVIEMTIDEAIAKYKEIANTDANCPAHCNISCDKCVQESKQLAEWLEELKAIKEKGRYVQGNKAGQKIGYNKAIDDFVESVKNLIADSSVIRFKDIDEIAEQLKAGGNIELPEHSESQGD